MSLTFGFYNSLEGDRRYNAEQMSMIFDGIIADGVYAAVGDCLKVKPSTGMTILVGSGRAWFNHTWTYNSTDLPLTIEDADSLLNRYDTIVLEVNSSSSVRANSIKVVKGTPATEPKFPDLTTTSTLHQYPLAYIYIPKGETEITAKRITNNIGKTSCPWVISPLKSIDVTDIYRRWEDQKNEKFSNLDAWILRYQNNYKAEMTSTKNNQTAEFNDWFSKLKSALADDVAANLYQEMINLQDKIDTATALANRLDPEQPYIYYDFIARVPDGVTKEYEIEDSNGKIIKDSSDESLIAVIVKRYKTYPTIEDSNSNTIQVSIMIRV